MVNIDVDVKIYDEVYTQCISSYFKGTDTEAKI